TRKRQSRSHLLLLDLIPISIMGVEAAPNHCRTPSPKKTGQNAKTTIKGGWFIESAPQHLEGAAAPAPSAA
ncbi:MAG TPA: hypothetical protein VFI93_10130, partial [Rhizomicrobium sp.]|nr:hypothetical protein [Rhizomicrobium sp.]